MTERMLARHREPAHRHPRALHRDGSWWAGAASHPIRRRRRIRGLRPHRYRRRDQLPAGAPRSAAELLLRAVEPRVSVQHRHRRPRPRPAGMARARLPAGRRRGRSRRARIVNGWERDRFPRMGPRPGRGRIGIRGLAARASRVSLTNPGAASRASHDMPRAARLNRRTCSAASRRDSFTFPVRAQLTASMVMARMVRTVQVRPGAGKRTGGHACPRAPIATAAPADRCRSAGPGSRPRPETPSASSAPRPARPGGGRRPGRASR